MEAPQSSSAANVIDDHASGTYILRDLIKDIPLSTDDDGKKAYITCVDSWNENLYIGTSAGEVLHYVSIPDDSGQPSYIFATKLEPTYTTKQEGADAGVKQILLLAEEGKACILCNGTLTFYTLPELSPAFGEKIKQSSCLWVGGLDVNEDQKEIVGGTVIVICLRQRLRFIKIGKEARKVRDIELPNVAAIQRRGNLACVADGNTYALLDVVNHRKNDLFPISSLTALKETDEKPLPDLPQRASHGASRSVSAASPSPTRTSRGHERNVSLGAEPRQGSTSPWPARASSRQLLSPAQPSSREQSPAGRKSEDAVSPRQSLDVPQASVEAGTRLLPPNIASPTSSEFLLTMGTKFSESGVGMFVNLDGDVSRPPMAFSSYPESLVLDGGPQSLDSSASSTGESAGYVLALVRRHTVEGTQKVIEVQRWDDDPSEAQRPKEWLILDFGQDEDNDSSRGGLRNSTSTAELFVPEIKVALTQRRLQLQIAPGQKDDDKRDIEEDQIASRFAQIKAGVLFYSSDKVSWVAQNPLIVRLEQRLDSAVRGELKRADDLSIDVAEVQKVVNSIRGQEPRSELEFLTLKYIRQKASLLLFGNLVLQTASGTICYEQDKRNAEEALIAGEIDPRTVLAIVPPLVNEVEEGAEGIWLSQGLRNVVDLLRLSFDSDGMVQDPKGAYGDNLLAIIKRYLLAWRKKKGLASVADEAQVFRSVDAALLYILLLQDQNSPRGPSTAGTVRAELNDVVDKGVDCFERAKELFEQFGRLYMLSRLYQSRKMVAQVLATWRRILEGEKDTGGELIEGEQALRTYLAKLRDQNLVQEYGGWLANRNPKLGVQVFADDNGRVRFQPSEAVSILKEKAPGAVKDYLEHLVFGKNYVQYVNDLIAFYLDTVLTELERSDDAQNILLQSYETYRALRPPKPTYRQFITENAIDAEWWHNRLRLLQLIGGSHGAASKYDVHTLGERLAPYSDELVPEMIILNGREGKHEEALRLLTHGLGDYDTAIRYCLLGGLSIFHPSSGLAPEQPLPSKEEQAKLFEYLLHEFFKIEDLNERLERTAELLERFGGWFDVDMVLGLIPDSWSVELISAFLVQALRRLVREKNETGVAKALASAQNLKRSVEVIEKLEGFGPMIERAEIETG